MSCEIVTKVLELYSAYEALLSRCCTGLTVPEPDECVVDAIWTVYDDVTNLFSSPSCEELTADPAYPDPGAPEGCIDPQWLEDCLAWIQGITCGLTCIRARTEVDGQYYYETLTGGPLVFTGSSFEIYWNEAEQQWWGKALTVHHYPGGEDFLWFGPSTEDDPLGVYDPESTEPEYNPDTGMTITPLVVTAVPC